MSVRSIRPGQIHGRFQAPPSKSYTHRALVAAFLAHRRTEVVRPLDSDDTRATRDGLRALGAHIRLSQAGWTVLPPRKESRPRPVVRCGESGTTLRLLSAVAALGKLPVSFDGAPSLARRPMGELYTALSALGANVHTPRTGRALPSTIRGPLRAGTVEIRGDVSSQFTSALLMALPTVPGQSTLRVRGRAVSQPYIDATLALCRDRYVRIRRRPGEYVIPGGQRYHAGRIRVPGDASSAAYLWAAAAATGGEVKIEGVVPDLPQADLAILPILSRMGARVHRSARYVQVAGSLSRPLSVDLTGSPDLFPLVSVLAALVPNERSELRGAPHLEFKESDRRRGSIQLARALGAKVSAQPGRIDVTGTDRPRSVQLPGLRDHRLVMSAAVAGLVGSGVSHVGVAEAVSKSFPRFWEVLQALTQNGETVG